MKIIFISSALLCFQFTFGNVIHSVQSGNWNSSSTWKDGFVPQKNDSTVILFGHEIIMNSDNIEVQKIEVQGTLKWTSSYTTKCKTLYSKKGATFLSSSATGTLQIDELYAIEEGICTVANVNLICNNQCNIRGTLLMISDAGSKTFYNICVFPFGVWNNQSNSDPIIRGNIKNDGTWKACTGSACTYHFPNTSSISGDSLVTLPRMEGNSTNTFTNAGRFSITHAINGFPHLINQGKLYIALSPLTFHVSSFSTEFPENTVIYNDTAMQNIFQPNSGSYENLELANGVKQLQGNLLINNNCTIKPLTTLHLDTFKLQGNKAASFILDSLATLIIGNNKSTVSAGFPANFNKINLHHYSTVKYQAKGDENIASNVVYGNLNIDDGSVTQSVKYIQTDSLTVLGNLTLEESSVLVQCKHCVIQLSGDWNGNGNLKMTDGTFNFQGNGNNSGVFEGGTSTFTYNGISDQIVKVGKYYKLCIDKPFGKAVLKGSNNILAVRKLLHLAKGTFEIGNETIDVSDSIWIEGALTFTSTKQSKKFQHFIIDSKGIVLMKTATTIHVLGQWSNTGTFTAGKGEVVFSDSITEQEISGNSTFYNLSINKKSNTLTLSSSISVTHNLQMISGKLNLRDYNIHLSSTSKIVNESEQNHIYGDAGKIEITKNILGSVNDSLGNLGIVISASKNLGLTTLSRCHQSTIINGFKSIQRIYHILPNVNSQLNERVIFSFLNSETKPLEKANLELWKSEDGVNNWGKFDGTLDTLKNQFTAQNISSFSFWTLVPKIDDPLPVTWLSFKLHKNQQDIALEWTTGFEKNLSYYSVESSENGIHFNEVDQVLPLQSINIIHNYYFNLPIPLATTYYRIKSIDDDGFISYSTVLVYTTNKIHNIEYQYFNIQGIEVFRSNAPPASNIDLPEGLFFYKTSEGNSGKIYLQDLF